MSTPDDPKRPRTDHLFIGGGSNDDTSEAAAPTPQPPRSKSPSGRQPTRPPSGHPAVAGRPTSRRLAVDGAPAAGTRNDGARLVTIIAVCVGILGLISLVLLLSNSRTVTIPPNKAPESVAPKAQPSTGPIAVPPPPARPTPPASTISNLMPNPSVEELVDGRPLNWERMTYSGKAQFSVSDQARRGKHSLCITSATGGDAGWLVTLAVKPKTSYLFKGWIRTENLTGNARGALFNLHPTEIQSNAITGTTGWKHAQFQFDSGNNTEVHINCLFGGWGRSTGTAWYDDFEVIELFSTK